VEFSSHIADTQGQLFFSFLTYSGWSCLAATRKIGICIPVFTNAVHFVLTL